MEKGFGKEGDGARRHFRHTGIVILTKIAIPIRPKHGPFYDGTAALNNYSIWHNCVQLLSFVIVFLRSSDQQVSADQTL